ncbi:MAG TPA: methyltransferase domain-containing protein [Bryobacteraceae bacterium]|nr:methyltransferase domain-containing protein [Bryobacteraceae bacterium]
MHSCPACGSHTFHRAVALRTVRQEIRQRRNFVYSRLRRRASQAELKDLLDFMHGFPAPLVECAGCGLLTRAEADLRGASSYEEDTNDPDILTQVYPRYVQAFRNKEAAYRERLRPHADVLEIGSHIGAFLQTAEEWNWVPLGLDVGRDTTEFIRRRGLHVWRETLENARLAHSSFDAVFVWNCFEQITDPGPVLAAVRRVLKEHGLLIVRVPNAFPYRVLRADLLTLAWNNLLGFPYLYGYTIENLNRLVARFGFEHVRGFNSELVTMPFADVPNRLRAEQKAISRRAAEWSTRTSAEASTLTGPWIEVIYRRLSERDWLRTSRVPLRRIDPSFVPRAA